MKILSIVCTLILSSIFLYSQDFKVEDQSIWLKITLDDLVQKSDFAHVALPHKKFGDVKVSPKKDKIAFIVTPNSWFGILDLGTQKVLDLEPFFDGEFNTIYWSPDGDFVAVEMTPPSGLSDIGVYSLKNKSLIVSMSKMTKVWPVKTYSPEWSFDSKALRFKSKDPDGSTENTFEFNIKSKSILRR